MIRPTILVIDDNASSRAHYVKVLASESFSASQASHADEALRVAERIHPDIVILDLIRPRSGGQSLARTLKSRDQETAIVAITATSTALPSLAEGDFVAALAKPFDREELVDLVRGLCRPEWLGVSEPAKESTRPDGKNEGPRSPSRRPRLIDRTRSRLSHLSWLNNLI